MASRDWLLLWRGSATGNRVKVKGLLARPEPELVRTGIVSQIANHAPKLCPNGRPLLQVTGLRALDPGLLQ